MRMITYSASAYTTLIRTLMATWSRYGSESGGSATRAATPSARAIRGQLMPAVASCAAEQAGGPPDEDGDHHHEHEAVRRLRPEGHRPHRLEHADEHAGQHGPRDAAEAAHDDD